MCHTKGGNNGSYYGLIDHPLKEISSLPRLYTLTPFFYWKTYDLKKWSS